MRTGEANTEVWKDVPGFAGKYQVSDLGRVRSVTRPITHIGRWGRPFTRVINGRVLRPGRYDEAGHVSVVLGRGENGRPVHQLVLLAFKGPCPAGLEVLHTDGDPSNNRLENLRYDTRRNNILDVFRINKAWRKLTRGQADEIKAKLAAGERGTKIAAEYNVSPSIISDIKTGRCHACEL